MSQNFEQKVAKIVKEQFKKYKIKENLSEFEDAYQAFKKLAPPNEGYKYFTDWQKAKMAFKPNAVVFELTNAWWLMQVSLLAFDEAKNAKPIFQNVGFNVQFIENKDTSTQCYILEKEDFIIVVFRGSQVRSVKSNLEDIIIDWMTDTKIDLVPFDIAGKIPIHFDGKIHSGFREAFSSIWNKSTKNNVNLGKIFQKLAEKNKPVWFTGHSLGAALATLAASSYEGNVQGLYTFGSPRVGDRDFVDALTKKLLKVDVYRFIYKDDIVTKVPLIDLDLEVYKHIGTVKYINNNNIIEDSPNLIIKLAHDLKTTVKNLLAELGQLVMGQQQIKLRAKLISEILITVAPTGIPNHAPIFYAIVIEANLRAKTK
ncbi:MAG: lipase family protein [Acidobacteria bacterium]|nr:lipase family protein [Acidobacteriota bacterium]